MTTEYLLRDYGYEEFSQRLDLASDVFNLLRQGGQTAPGTVHKF